MAIVKFELKTYYGRVWCGLLKKTSDKMLGLLEHQLLFLYFRVWQPYLYMLINYFLICFGLAIIFKGNENINREQLILTCTQVVTSLWCLWRSMTFLSGLIKRRSVLSTCKTIVRLCSSVSTEDFSSFTCGEDSLWAGTPSFELGVPK